MPPFLALYCTSSGWRGPARPLALVLDDGAAGPGKAFATDTDAITQRLPIIEHQIAEAIGRIDDDRAGHFACRIRHDLAQIARVHLLNGNSRELISVIFYRSIHLHPAAVGGIHIGLWYTVGGIAESIDIDDRNGLPQLSATGEAGRRSCCHCRQEGTAGKGRLHMKTRLMMGEG